MFGWDGDAFRWAIAGSKLNSNTIQTNDLINPVCLMRWHMAVNTPGTADKSIPGG